MPLVTMAVVFTGTMRDARLAVGARRGVDNNLDLHGAFWKRETEIR